VADCSGRAAARADAADRRADGICRERPGRPGPCRGVPRGTPEARLDGEPQCPDRNSLGDGRPGVDATIRDGNRRVAARSHCYAKYTHHRGDVATNAQHPHHFATGSDPVGSGFVASFARPGGNVTGFIDMEASLASKWLGLLKEIAPRVARVAFLFNPATAPFAEYYLNPFKAAAPSLAVEAIAAPVHDTSSLESVIAAQASEPSGGLIVMPETFLNVHRAEVTSLAARYRLPTVYPWRFYTKLGGLLSYGIDLPDNYGRAAIYADRILKGVKPSELPVQAPVKLLLVINLKTAKELQLEVPLSLLIRADELVE
jgi:ABC-type uncharacterized transport system substrate-binding protein